MAQRYRFQNETMTPIGKGWPPGRPGGSGPGTNSAKTRKRQVACRRSPTATTEPGTLICRFEPDGAGGFTATNARGRRLHIRTDANGALEIQHAGGVETDQEREDEIELKR